MAELHRDTQTQRKSRSLSGRLGFMFKKSRLEKAMAADHKAGHNISAFKLYNEGSINHNRNSVATSSPSPRLPILSRNFYSETPGSMTPPFNSFCSVPFKWEEAPGKAKNRLADDQLISSYEGRDGFCRRDYDYEEDFDLNVFKVVDGAVGFQVDGRLVAVYAATSAATYHDGGNDHTAPPRRRSRGRPIFTKLFGEMMGRLRSAIDSVRRIW